MNDMGRGPEGMGSMVDTTDKEKFDVTEPGPYPEEAGQDGEAKQRTEAQAWVAEVKAQIVDQIHQNESKNTDDLEAILTKLDELSSEIAAGASMDEIRESQDVIVKAANLLAAEMHEPNA